MDKKRQQRRRNISRLNVGGRLLVWAIVAVLSFSPAAFAQKKTKEATPEGKPVLWQEPTDLESRNLFLGPGGEEMKPDLSSINFVKEEGKTGYSVKYRVRDGAGREWVAKLGNEARPETASLRLVWAVGYATEVNYLVPCVQIKGAPAPRKDVKRCEGKGFADVRFEARPDGVKRLDAWSWKQNPFTGTREMRGLIILMALLNNWDLKDENNRILYVPGGEGGEATLRYIVSDLGATFGKTGGPFTHSRNEPEKYVKTKFIEEVKDGRVVFHYDGKNQALFNDIAVEDAKWIGALLGRVTDEQLSDAFRAANFKPEEIEVLTQEVRSRIAELVNLGVPATPEATSATPAQP